MGNDTDPPEGGRGLSRREALTSAAGLLVGAVATEALAGATPSAAVTAPASLLLGTANFETATTTLENDSSAPALEVYTRPGRGGASAAVATRTVGLIGSTGGYPVTTVDSLGAAGVVGIADGAVVTATAAAGVLGVIGTSFAGLSATARALPAGVQGFGVGPGVVGVGAIGVNAPALQVIGDVQFSTTGSITVPRGARSVAIADPGVTHTSVVLVTLNSSPGNTTVSWVQLQPGTGFIVHLTGVAPTSVALAYFRIS